MVLLASATSQAGQAISSPQAFVFADHEQKTQTLVSLIRHQSASDPDTTAGLIAAALSDPDDRIREAGLAAIVSRAAGPKFDRSAPVADEWLAEHQRMESLRPAAIGALDDSAEAVRVQAIAAVASLDFDPSKSDVSMSENTQQLLARRFYEDPSPRVRAKIVSGFGTDVGASSPAARKLLIQGFNDPDYRVRHAAMSGVAKLDPDVAIDLVVQQLADDHRDVRVQAASVLATFGSSAAGKLDRIEERIAQEPDPQVRQLLQRATALIRGR